MKPADCVIFQVSDGCTISCFSVDLQPLFLGLIAGDVTDTIVVNDRWQDQTKVHDMKSKSTPDRPRARLRRLGSFGAAAQGRCA